MLRNDFVKSCNLPAISLNQKVMVRFPHQNRPLVIFIVHPLQNHEIQPNSAIASLSERFSSPNKEPRPLYWDVLGKIK